MLKDMEKAKGTAGTGNNNVTGGNIVAPPDTPPTLTEIGITKRQSSDWQKVADIEENIFEDAERYGEGERGI